MFDWADYLTLAERMVALGQPDGAPEECRLRCAVGRAYYAAFGRARRFLTDLYGAGKVPADKKVHEYVIGQFRDDRHDDGRTWQAIGSDLEDLREARNHADYGDESANWVKKCEESLLRARRAIQRLQQLV
jgi:uncharacterized protein (UPF0332 family)